MKISIIDLFCGAGGISYGMESSGAEVVAGFDIDNDSLTTFAHNHPSAKAVHCDLSEPLENIHQYKGVEMVVGGPPCQGFSISGKRNPKDIRNNLYKIYIETLAALKPRMFILENVPNMISMDNGRFKDELIQSLGALGYKINFQIVTASDYGIPQKRRRVFFFGSLEGFFTFKIDSHNEVVSCKEALSDLPDISQDNGVDYSNYPSSNYQKLMREKSSGVWNHVITNHTEQTKKIIAMVPDGGNYKDLPAELQGTRKVNIAWTRYSSSKPSHTIDTGHRHHFHYKYNRVPTVRENARLQSFDDKFIFLGTKTSQYRQVGNAVPPLLAAEIFSQLKETKFL